MKTQENQDSLLLNLSVSGNSPPANPSGRDGSPLTASQMGAFLLDLHEKLGIDFMAKFIQQLRIRPGSPQGPISAARKVQEEAAARAAGRELSEFFVKRWRWP